VLLSFGKKSGKKEKEEKKVENRWNKRLK